MGNIIPNLNDMKGSTYDSEGYNGYGFHKTTHLHKKTGTNCNSSGKTSRGFQLETRIVRGNRFEESWIHQGTGRRWDHEGYDVQGWKITPENVAIHYETKTQYDPEGYNYYGLDTKSCDRDGDYINMDYDGKGAQWNH